MRCCRGCRLAIRFNNTGPADAVLYDQPLGWWDPEWVSARPLRLWPQRDPPNPVLAVLRHPPSPVLAALPNAPVPQTEGYI